MAQVSRRQVIPPGSHSARVWIPAFIVLFVAYQAPEGLGLPALMLAFLPIAWLVARALRLGMGPAYALEWNLRSAMLLAVGFLVALTAKAAALAIGARLAIYSPAAAGHEGTAAAMFAAFAMLTLSTFLPAIAEDIVTRGFWARIPAIRWTGVGFVLFSALLYLGNHLYRLANGPTEWLMLFCFGLAYATAFWKSGSLWAAVGLHWGWNFAGPGWGMFWPYDVAQVEEGRMLSAATHLLLFAILLLIPRQRVHDIQPDR